MRYDFGPANHHAAACLSKIQFIPWRVKEVLRNKGQWEDLIQELYAAAWEAYTQGLEISETFKLGDRRLGEFMRAYGFSKYAKRYGIREIPFAEVFDYELIDSRGLCDKGLPPPAPPCQMTFYRSSSKPEECDEKVLACLKKYPGGLTRSMIACRLLLPVKEVECCLKRLVEKGLVAEVKRQNTRGRPFTPLYVATEYPRPKSVMAAHERDERIRHAYFVEGKSIKQIAKEFHHSKQTVRAAIRGGKQR